MPEDAQYELDYDMLNPGQYPAEVRAAFKDRVAAGWRVLSALPAYSELCILWERGSALPTFVLGSSEQTAPDGMHHVDWLMTDEEWSQLAGVLAASPKVPYIASLIADGAIPLPGKAKKESH